MLDELYNQRILTLAGAIPRIGRLPQPHATSTQTSRLCGSTITVDLCMDGNTVTDFAHEVRACALGQATASIVARKVVGSTRQELLHIGQQMRAMLKNHGPAPVWHDTWKDLSILQSVRDYKGRHGSVLLPFDAIEDAMARIDSIAPKSKTP